MRSGISINDEVMIMVCGVGADIIEVERIRGCLTRYPRFAERIFTATERFHLASYGDPAERVAGRFAAKEAVAKALGARLRWHEVEILPDETGKPVVTLSGRAAEIAGMRRLLVSISHCRTHAMACAVVISV